MENHSFQKGEQRKEKCLTKLCVWKEKVLIPSMNFTIHTDLSLSLTRSREYLTQPCDCYKFKQPCDFQVGGNPQYFCSEFSKGLNHLKKKKPTFLSLKYY